MSFSGTGPNLDEILIGNNFREALDAHLDSQLAAVVTRLLELAFGLL